MSVEERGRVRVLVAEDEESFIDALEVNLSREGFDVEFARDGVEALTLFEKSAPDLILLDVMLPKMSGFDVCRAIRTHSKVPIIMVTARSTEIDTVVGLEIGADDYVSKPYRMRELISRMRAVLRRAGRPSNGEETSGGGQEAAETETQAPGRGAGAPRHVLAVGDVRLDLDRHECTVRGHEVSLPLKEFELLEQLLLHAGRVMTRDALIDGVWGLDYVGDTKTLDVHIKRLRSRIEPDPANPVLITTIRGLGYRFETPRPTNA